MTVFVAAPVVIVQAHWRETVFVAETGVAV